MVLPEPPLRGACLCGAVQVNVTASPLLTLACHCRDCQKLCASAYSLTTMFPSDGFSYTGELIKGGLGSSGRTHYFCKSCLNFVFSQIGGADQRINLRTSVLSEAASFEPFVELMTDDSNRAACLGQVFRNGRSQFCSISLAPFGPRRPESLEELQALMDEYSER